MRVVVQIDQEAHSTVCVDLEKISKPRYRAERLRHLATLGITGRSVQGLNQEGVHWDKTQAPATNMRVVVQIDREAHPELYEELEKISNPRYRAERLRHLATLGITGHTTPEIKQEAPAQVKAPAPAAKKKEPVVQKEYAEEEEKDPHEEHRGALISGMASQFS